MGIAVVRPATKLIDLLEVDPSRKTFDENGQENTRGDGTYLGSGRPGAGERRP
jgi:hypothetical protein